MNEAIMWAMYGAGFMAIAMSIKLFITGKINLDLIPATAFGLVCGGIGYTIYNALMLELYPIHPTLTIVSLSFLGLGILGIAVSIIFRRIE